MPKTVLELYNCARLHHELCQKLFMDPRDCTGDPSSESVCTL